MRLHVVSLFAAVALATVCNALLRENVQFGPLDPNVTDPTTLFLDIENPVPRDYCKDGQLFNPSGNVDPSPGPFPFDIFYDYFNPNTSAVPTNVWQKNLWGFEWNDTTHWNGVYMYPYILTAKQNSVTAMYMGLPGDQYTTPPQPINSRVGYHITDLSPDANVTGAEYPLLIMADAFDFGVLISNGNYPKITNVDDLSATIEYSETEGGAPVATLYVVKGSPYINIECNGAMLEFGSTIPGVPPVISLNNNPPGTTVSGQTFVATAAVGSTHLAGETWHVYFDEEVEVNFQNAPDNPVLTAPYTGLLQVGCGEVNDSMGSFLDSNAGVYAKGGSVEYDIDDEENTMYVRFEWDVGTSASYAKSLGRGYNRNRKGGSSSSTSSTSSEANLAMLLLPHHTKVIEPLAGQAAPVNTSYWTVNGHMSAFVGGTWRMAYNLTTAGWGDDLKPNPADQDEIMAQLQFDYDLYVDSCPGDDVENASHPGWDNQEFYSYFRDLAKYTDLAVIASAMGQDEMVANLTQRIVYCMAPAGWKQTTPPQPCPPSQNNSNVCVRNQMAMYYDNTWGGVITGWYNRFAVLYCEGCKNTEGYYPLANYGNTLYNDHHFQYGYYVRCAAWVIYQASKGVDVNMTASELETFTTRALVFARDYANPNVTLDKWFPNIRHKDQFDGHSWAEGYDYSGRVNAWINQEGGGEAVNSYYAIYLLGLALNDQNVIDWGRVNLATEQVAVRTYQHLSTTEPDIPYPPLNAMMRCMPMLQGNGVVGTTFYGPQALFDCGASILPFTTITQEWVDTAWAGEALEWMEMKNAMSGVCAFPDPLNETVNICPGKNNPSTYWANEWECCPYNIPAYVDNLWNAYPDWYPLMYLIGGLNDTDSAWESLQVVNLTTPTPQLPFPYVNSFNQPVGYFDGISRTQALWFLSTLPSRSGKPSFEQGPDGNIRII